MAKKTNDYSPGADFRSEFGLDLDWAKSTRTATLPIHDEIYIGKKYVALLRVEPCAKEVS